MTTEMPTVMNQILKGLNIDAECIEAEKHRHLAHYDIKLTPGTKVRDLENNYREIALGLKSKTNPIIDPIPEKGIVRIKVAHRNADLLPFLELYNKTSKPEGCLQFLLGETDIGEPLWVDMAKNPHMLIAGTTGSGKSTILHIIIANALLRKDVKLYLIDPKQGVEFARYKDKAKIITTYDDSLNKLELLHKEMENRYEIMSKFGYTSIEQMRNQVKIMVIIDEVSDLILMDSAKKNINKGKLEELLVSLAQKARAAGIYLVAATQRPSVDVLTGILKANFPARIACKVSSRTDSSVILDRLGAESLLGCGDAIINTGKYNYVRFQAAYVD